MTLTFTSSRQVSAGVRPPVNSRGTGKLTCLELAKEVGVGVEGHAVRTLPCDPIRHSLRQETRSDTRRNISASAEKERAGFESGTANFANFMSLQEAREKFIEADRFVFAVKDIWGPKSMAVANLRRRQAYAAWIDAVRRFNAGEREEREAA